MNPEAQALRDFADQLQKRRQYELKEKAYWAGERPHRWNMHYWRAEALERAIKAARDKARRIENAATSPTPASPPLAERNEA